MALLTRFAATRPPYVMSQAHSLDWLARAHACSEAAIAGLDPAERAAFVERMVRLLGRVGCSASQIAMRASVLPDFTTCDRDGSELHVLYDDPDAAPAGHPHGRPAAVRSELYGAAVDAYFAAEYSAETAPDDIIHVTCTGYLSPSGAQKMVAARGWGGHTRVLHAYHMGCYAALPAVRMADALLAAGSARADIVH